MSIDLANETPITLAKAAQTLPGGAVHVSTVHRWRMKGCRGVRLESFLRGGKRMTTREAIERFTVVQVAHGCSLTVNLHVPGRVIDIGVQDLKRRIFILVNTGN